MLVTRRIWGMVVSVTYIADDLAGSFSASACWPLIVEVPPFTMSFGEVKEEASEFALQSWASPETLLLLVAAFRYLPPISAITDDAQLPAWDVQYAWSGLSHAVPPMTRREMLPLLPMPSVPLHPVPRE